jgi:hypothetical protein
MNGRRKRMAIEKESTQYPVGLLSRLLLTSFTFIAHNFYFCKGESLGITHILLNVKITLD